MTSKKRLLAAAVSVLALGAAAGCGGADAGSGATSGEAVTLRLGYFPNLTHATAIVGVQDGHFTKALGDAATLKTTTFNAGPAAVEAIFSGAIDATYIGPGPATNAYVKSKGEAIKIISGATSGGAALVVKSEITAPAQLKGKRIATPQLGNTQDIALRYWLASQGLKSTKEGGGDVKITPQENAQSLDTFATGAIDGAWVPEPWATRLVNEGGKVLVDERSLWPDGKFVTTNLIVRTAFLDEHPDVVESLLEGQLAANEEINSDPAKAQKTVNAAIEKLTGKALAPEVISAAWKNLTFTDDPLPATLLAGADHAVEVGLLQEPELDGIYDLEPLNTVLAAAGKPEVANP